MTNAEFVNKYGTQAVQAAKGSGIFPETLLAQAILESASGKSLLTTKYNAFFGIKDTKDWTGPTVNMKTGEILKGKPEVISSNFRAYGSFEESARDYIKFLKVNPRYTKAGVFTAKTYTDQIKAIAAAGYATGVNYAKSLIQIANGIVDDISRVVKNNGGLLGTLLLLTGTFFFN
jgi:flagellum-specific peptidoglycan hydrolase FlgJ